MERGTGTGEVAGADGGDPPSVYVDGAHNVSAIDAFVKSVPETAEGNIFLFSAVKDKEYEEMIAHLCDSVPAEFYVVTLIDGERATDAELLGKLFEKYTDRPVVVIESVQKALELCPGASEKKDCVLSGITLSDRDGQGDGRADAKRKSRRKPEEKKLKGSRKSRSWKQQQTERAADMWEVTGRC